MSAPIRTSPGCAAVSRRAAVLTASPVTRPKSVDPGPTRTSPVFTPIRDASRTPKSRSRSLFSVSRLSRMPSAARTALSASSSWRDGIPNTAMTASPMNFSTVPPWSSISARIASKYLAMTFRRDSGSSCSPSCVDPVTSQKRIVTVFRTSSAGEDAGSAEPQFEQNLASAALAAPQVEHAVMRRSLGSRCGGRIGGRGSYPPGGRSRAAHRAPARGGRLHRSTAGH